MSNQMVELKRLRDGVAITRQNDDAHRQAMIELFGSEQEYERVRRLDFVSKENAFNLAVARSGKK